MQAAAQSDNDPLGIKGRFVAKEFHGLMYQGVVHSFRYGQKRHTRHRSCDQPLYRVVYEHEDWDVEASVEELEPGEIDAILI